MVSTDGRNFTKLCKLILELFMKACLLLGCNGYYDQYNMIQCNSVANQIVDIEAIIECRGGWRKGNFFIISISGKN